MAKEILREVPDLDVLLVCCGGGSLLAGLAAGVALLGSKAIVYGVEPTGADKMKRSLIEGQAVRMPEAHSIATGLCPPIASIFTLNSFIHLIIINNFEVKWLWSIAKSMSKIFYW